MIRNDKDVDKRPSALINRNPSIRCLVGCQRGSASQAVSNLTNETP